MGKPFMLVERKTRDKTADITRRPFARYWLLRHHTLMLLKVAQGREGHVAQLTLVSYFLV